MKIAVLGAGGVGGYYGGLLAHCGHDVTFIARGKHLEAIREHGLSVQSVHGDFTIVSARATDKPTVIGAVDLVLVAVKSYDLEEAAQSARPLVGPRTVVLPLLNGLDAAERLTAIFGEKPVLAGLTHLSSGVAAPGVIRQVSPVRRITLGERHGPPGEISARVEQIRELLAGSGVEARSLPAPELKRALWEKFIFIASIGGICCLARQPMGIVISTPETRQLYVEALQEVEAVGRAWGVELDADIIARSLQITAGFAPATRPSLLADLEAGQRLELEAMSGTVVRYGRQTGVPTPIHWVVYAALKPRMG